MKRDVTVLLVGWLLGVGSGVLLAILNHWLELRRDRIKRGRDKQTASDVSAFSARDALREVSESVLAREVIRATYEELEEHRRYWEKTKTHDKDGLEIAGGSGRGLDTIVFRMVYQYWSSRVRRLTWLYACLLALAMFLAYWVLFGQR